MMVRNNNMMTIRQLIKKLEPIAKSEGSDIVGIQVEQKDPDDEIFNEETYNNSDGFTISDVYEVDGTCYLTIKKIKFGKIEDFKDYDDFKEAGEPYIYTDGK